MSLKDIWRSNYGTIHQKTALVAEIERRRDVALMRQHNLEAIGQETRYNEIIANELNRVLQYIDTLEVKEVDLGNEYTEEIYSHLDSIKDTADRMTSGNFMHNRAVIKFSANTIAKVLELMGLKAQKRE